MKDPLFQKLGSMGGKATAKKYGRKHFQKLSKRGRAALRKKLGIPKLTA